RDRGHRPTASTRPGAHGHPRVLRAHPAGAPLVPQPRGGVPGVGGEPGRADGRHDRRSAMSAPSTAAPATRLEPDGPRPPRRRSTALKSLWRTLAPPATTIVTVVVLWQLVVSLLQVATYLVPGPMDVFRDLWDNRELFAIHTKVTGVEVLTGFGLAVVVG